MITSPYLLYPMHPKRVGGVIKPRGIIWHYTAMAESTEMALAKVWGASKGKGNGATALIRRNGQIVQFCDFGHNANHAGGGTTGRIVFRRDTKSDGTPAKYWNPNSCCIGIELSNPGRVRKDTKGWYIAYQGSTRTYVPSEIVVADTKHPGWGDCSFTEEQKTSAKKIAEMAFEGGMRDEPIILLRQTVKGVKYGSIETGSMRLGHMDCDPSRKGDPGPLWNPREIIPQSYWID